MVISKLVSGLGNQLFQFAVGRQISLSNKTSLKLDISFFTTQHLRNFKLDHYNIKATIASEYEVNELLETFEGGLLMAKLRQRLELLLPKYKRRYFKEKEWWIYEPELFKTSANTYLDGYWQHYRYFEHLSPQILDELTLKEPPQGQAKFLAHELSQNNAAVSIHIRRGDYVSDITANNLMGVLPTEYYQKAVDYIASKIKKPAYYVFSDDLDWAKNNLKIDGTVHLVDIAGGTQDYTELDLMSKCSHNIIANSSFSWWGAFLNRNPNKIVVAPAKWVLPEAINRKIELQFPTWIKM